MLNIYFGDMPEAIYDPATYFKNTYKDSWITNKLSVEMIKDVDKSTVVAPRIIESPVLGGISPIQLSGGVKTLMLVANDKSHVFNASACGDNCAKWLLKIAENRKVVVNMHHLMDFGDEPFKIRVMNNNKIVKNMTEFVIAAYQYV